MDQVSHSLPGNLRRLRGDMSQAEFARFLGISQPRYANYESGNREPDLITLCRIAAMTTGSVDELIGMKSMKPPDNAATKVADLKRAIITLLKEY